MTRKALTVLAFGLSAFLVAPAAHANPLKLGKSSNSTSVVGSAPVAAPTSLEIDMAESKVSTTHKKLDQAKQQLEAAKAHLKAAEAEFKAAQADKAALVLRTKARELASASGIEQTVDTVTTAPSTTTVTEAPTPGANRIDLAPSGQAPAATTSAPTLQDLAP